MVDLEYTNSGMFTRFYPVTSAGENAWREMAKEDGCAAVLSVHAKNVISQLRKAGYTIAKVKKSEKQSLEQILAELGV